MIYMFHTVLSIYLLFIHGDFQSSSSLDISSDTAATDPRL